jgi:GNAT superfamily N-acetyltransferase
MADASTAATVRALQSEDFEQWLKLWDGYLSFYREQLPEELTRHTFQRLSGGDAAMAGLVAVVGGQLAGLAHLVLHPRTWSRASTCYLEDLFVDPAHRGGSTAKALIDATYAEARRRGCDRVYWQTQQFNGVARSFYDRVGQLTSAVIYEHELD